MSLLWDLYWPALAVAFVLGLGAGLLAFRASGRRRTLWLTGAIAAAIAVAAVWHGPLGAGSRLRSEVETVARAALVHYEMAAVQARFEDAPMTRELVLTGPADDFQRAELVRMMGNLPGVSGARWEPSSRPDSFDLPLAVEAAIASLVALGLGLLLAYLLELRRRSNAQWRW